MNYYNFKKQYVESGTFISLSGDYAGYVSVLSGVPFVHGTNIMLSSLPTFDSDLITSTRFRDRTIDESINLPYSEDDILFQPNDYLTANLLNDKFNMIQENNTYIYSRMFMADNNLPSSDSVIYFGISGTNETEFGKYNNYSQTIPFFNSANYGYLSGVKDYVVTLNADLEDAYSILAITDSSFITLTGNSNELKVLERSTFIESEENSLPYGGLSNICRYRNFIYITDYKSDVIYKYDISGYYNNDTVLRNKRNYLESLGGRGNGRDKSKFNGPKQIATNGKHLAVYDSNNNVIKLYDLQFNYIDKLTNIPFIKQPVAAMEYSPHYDLFYIITYVDNNLRLYILDTECYKIVETFDYNITLSIGEVVKNIEFSKNSSEYYYICTTNEIYKFFVNNPTSLIGRYSENRVFNNIRATRTSLSSIDEITEVDPTSNLWSNQGTITFYVADWKWNAAPITYRVLTQGGVTSYLQTSMQNDKFSAGIRLLETKSNYDKGILLTGARVYVYNEPNRYKRTLKTYNLENYGKLDPGILDTDYIHTTAINKELYKLLRDIFTIKNNIVGRFSGAYDYEGILKLNDYNYNIDFSLFNLLDQESYYIADNEKNILGVINRPIDNILKLQRQLLELTKVDRVDVKPIITTRNSPYNNTYIL